MRHILLLALLPLLACGDRNLPASTETQDVYFGTYTRDEGWVNGQAAGIYRAEFNQVNGALSEPRTVATPVNPSFLTLTRDGNYLYAVSELARADEPTGYVHAYRRGPKGGLEEIGKQPADGKATCHVALNPSEDYLAVVNYSGGVAKLFARGEDGGLTPSDVFRVPESLKNDKESLLHNAAFSPDGRLLAIPDKGLDRVWLFDLATAPGKFTPWGTGDARTPARSGPRHATWSGDGSKLYVINELGSSVTVFERGTERLTEIQTISTLPTGYEGKNTCAEIKLHPNGKHLYGSNRGHNSIVSYTVDDGTGKLRRNGHVPTRGDTPRNFNLSPNGNFLLVASQDSDNVVVFRVDPGSGNLSFVDEHDIPTPVCVAF